MRVAGRTHVYPVCGCSGESALLGAVEEATAEAEKHGDRSERLAALVAEAREMIEQAKNEQAERARVAAEEAAAAAAVKAVAEAAEAAERLRVEEEVAALTLKMQGDALTRQSDALRLQQMQARLGSSVAPPAALVPGAEETLCVVCVDAPKQYAMLPCLHMCACGPCAQRLLELDPARCPVCRGPIERIGRVFC
jgi:hypothetical protein